MKTNVVTHAYFINFLRDRIVFKPSHALKTTLFWKKISKTTFSRYLMNMVEKFGATCTAIGYSWLIFNLLYHLSYFSFFYIFDEWYKNDLQINLLTIESFSFFCYQFLKL